MSEPDLITEAVQVRINDEIAGGYVVAHYVTIAGVLRYDENGLVDSRVIVATPPDQPDYITDALMYKAPEVLAELAELDAESASEEVEDE